MNHDLAASSDVREYRTSRDDERRYIFKLVLMMFLVLVLPAILVLLYLFLAPESIQYDIVPKKGLLIMVRPTFIVTREDCGRLVDLLKHELLSVIADPKAFRELAAELQHATIVDSVSVPADVVTMNSTVKLTDLESNETETYTLVYPENANIAEGRLPILAPIGTAILGYRVGNRLRWTVPDGKRYMRIDEVVYQPERETCATQHPSIPSMTNHSTSTAFQRVLLTIDRL